MGVPLLEPREPALTALPVARWRVAGTPRADGTPVSLPVAQLGRTEHPAVVLAHGVGSSARFVAAACAAPLAVAGYRLVVVDQRGHGDATPCPDPRDHALDAYADDLAAVTDSVPGHVAAVGGVSLGGHAAVRAQIGATARLAALPGWTGPLPLGHGPHAAIAEEVRRDGVAGLTARLRADTAMPRWLRATLLADYPRHPDASLAAALSALDGADGPDRHEIAALAPPQGGPGLAVVGWDGDPGHPWEVAALWAELTATEPARLAITDPEHRLSRFGDAVVAALTRTPSAWPPWADEPVVLVDPDPSWSDLAARHLTELRRLPELAEAPLLHVGSTAVARLPAKPVIDLLAGLAPGDAARLDLPLAAAGWALLPRDLDGRSWRRSWVLADGGRRRVHLHAVDPAHPRFTETVAFRDALRTDPALAARYAERKRRLAAAHRHDREAYTDGKAALVAQVLASRR